MLVHPGLVVPKTHSFRCSGARRRFSGKFSAHRPVPSLIPVNFKLKRSVSTATQDTPSLPRLESASESGSVKPALGGMPEVAQSDNSSNTSVPLTCKLQPDQLCPAVTMCPVMVSEPDVEVSYEYQLR